MKAESTISARRSISAVLLIGGWGMVWVGLAGSFSGFGWPLLIFCPLPFLAGAALAPTQARIAHAVLVSVCWLVGVAIVLAR